MSLRRMVRSTLTSGSQVLATVESYADGFATVRLAGSGSRLSNLPATNRLTPGQNVVIDYSAEGVPLVRPLSIAPTPVTPPPLEIVTKSERKVDGQTVLWNNDQFVSARYTRSSAMSIEGDRFAPFSQEHVTSTPIPFDTQVWDTHGMSGGVWGLTAPFDGRYFARATIAFSAFPTSLECKIQLTTSGAWSSGFAAKHTRYDQAETLILTVSQIVSLVAGAEVYATARYKNWIYSGDPDPHYITLPVDPQGAYPILEVALICPFGSDPKAIPWWFYYE